MNPSEIEQCRRRIMVVYSPAGGNGKSEIAANLAYCFAKRGFRTWILDANVFAPTQDIIFQYRNVGHTLSEFLLDSSSKDLPLYDLSVHFDPQITAPIYITPSCREDSEVRFQLHHTMNSLEESYGKIPEAIFHAFATHSIDLLIIDTHPSFEQINEVWLGITEFLLIISRMNDLDLENLKPLLSEGAVLDIAQKLVVFNNVTLDEEGRAREAMKNAIALQRFHEGLLERELVANHLKEGGELGRLEIYSEPFLYSRKLAMFGESIERTGLFVEKEPSDPFSKEIKNLAEYILNRHILTNTEPSDSFSKEIENLAENILKHHSFSRD